MVFISDENSPAQFWVYEVERCSLEWKEKAKAAVANLFGVRCGSMA
jgi:hypothetical protein